MGERPNILLICLDQMNQDWFSLHGHPLVRTPHMDSIGGTGISFARAHSECPTCIPARQTMMTGLDPWGINMFCNRGRQRFPEGRAKLAECLSAAGYQTHAVGKMHCYPARDRLGFHEVETDEEYRLDEMRICTQAKQTEPLQECQASWISFPEHLLVPFGEPKETMLLPVQL